MSKEYWEQWDKDEVDYEPSGWEYVETGSDYSATSEELDDMEELYRCERCSGCYYCLAVI